MSVVIRNDIGFGDASQAMFIDMARAKELSPARHIQDPIPANILSSLPWSPWGSNNLLPLEMLCDIKETPLLNAIIEGKSRFAICQGPVPVITKVDPTTGQKVIEKYVDDAEIEEFLETNNSFMSTFAAIKDYVGFNRLVNRIMLNKGRDKIALLQRDDVVRTRMEKMDGHARINFMYFSADWKKVRSIDDKELFKKPLLNPNNPVFDLRNRVSNGSKQAEFAMHWTHPGWNEFYYPVPLWMSAIKWIKIVQSIPEMKAAMYENSIRAKFVVVIHEDFWVKSYGSKWSTEEPKKKEEYRKKVYDDIEAYLVGAKNAGKAIFTRGFTDKMGKEYQDITFKPIDDRTKQGEYLPDAAAANSEIAFALLWNNAISGGNQKDGLFSGNEGGSNVREAALMQIILHEVERQQAMGPLRVVKHYNGWSKRLRGLDFIIPATTLTTLDTGAGTKPVVTGQVKPKEDATNKNS